MSIQKHAHYEWAFELPPLVKVSADGRHLKATVQDPRTLVLILEGLTAQLTYQVELAKQLT